MVGKKKYPSFQFSYSWGIFLVVSSEFLAVSSALIYNDTVVSSEVIQSVPAVSSG